MTQENSLQVQYIAIADIIPYARNSRTHSDEQIAQVAASIREFGFTNPILISDDFSVIAGHGRLLAAQRLEMDTVPTIALSGMTEAQRRAYCIADNKLAENAGWDDRLLDLELCDLSDLDIDLSLTGFSAEEIDALHNSLLDDNDGLTDPDSVPEEQNIAVSKLGDVWLLGKHRLICGDASNPLVVEKVLSNHAPHLMVTDPPYGVEYDAQWRNEAYRADGSPVGGSAIGAVVNDDKADWSDVWALFAGDVAYIWHASLKTQTVARSLEDNGFQLRSMIIWAKSNFAISRSDYHHKHEPCWYVVRKGATGHWNGDRKQTTVWEIQKPAKSETGHSTQKPVECMQIPIVNNSKPGDVVYEPFSGSGTTIIACETTHRVCCAIEINPPYVDLAVRRWQDFTGKDAVLESNSQTFKLCSAFADVDAD